jgi:hypothetical protein
MATHEMSEKISHATEDVTEDQGEHIEQIQLTTTIEVDNYHGLSLECILVYSVSLS